MVVVVMLRAEAVVDVWALREGKEEVVDEAVTVVEVVLGFE